jgi:antitoxin component YwqK of YwqJK toxin-antitoxin module
MTRDNPIKNLSDIIRVLKTLLILFSILNLTETLNGQEKVTLYYNSNWQVTKKDNATYFREAEFDLNNFKLDGSVIDYTLNGTLLMKGNYISDKKNGEFAFFYNNGNLKSKGNYDNDKRVGYWEYFYKDNKLKQKIFFPPKSPYRDFSVVEYYDSKGNQLIKNGTGKWINDSIEGTTLDRSSLDKLIGEFKDSVKVGEWKLYRVSDNKIIHRERFRKGKFIDATVYEPLFDSYGTISVEMLNKLPDENDSKLKKTEDFRLDTTAFPASLIFSDVETILKTVTGKDYKIRNCNASYPFGDNSLLEFIAANIQYPFSAIQKKASGKVYISVVIDSFGKSKEVKILKGVQEDLA